MWDKYCLPVMTPALRKKIAKFGTVPLMIKPMSEITEPTQITLRQPNLATRSAEIGPMQSIVPILVENTREVIERLVPYVSDISLKKIPNELSIPQTMRKEKI